MDKGIKLQKELAMGSNSAKREALSTAPSAGKKVGPMKKGGAVKRACGGMTRKK